MSHLFTDDGREPNNGRKVMLATTAYDSPDASYTFSLAKSRETLHQAGIPTAYVLLRGNCHVDDARNTVIGEFLQSDCSELVFLDADVSWEPEHLLRLCSHDLAIVGGVYPYRREGLQDTMPVRNKIGVIRPDKDGLLEVEGLPTGFLRIERFVIETLVKQVPWFRKNSRRLPILFERDLNNDGRRGGDIRFCMLAQEAGFKCYADTDLYLGHIATSILRDSLGASTRRALNETYRYVCDHIAAGTEKREHYQEMAKAYANNWAAHFDFLQIAVGLARSSKGDIIEMGSGLSTICMAAANPDVRVWAFEHHPVWAANLRSIVAQSGVKNVVMVECGLREGWYDLPKEDWELIPATFGLGVVDGPPRLLGDRMRFFSVLGNACETILCDDADDPGYSDKLEAWAEENERKYRVGDDRSAVIYKATP